MPPSLEDDLRKVIAERRVLVVVGSGVSVGATLDAPAASWTGLLKLGVDRCRQLNSSLDGDWAQRVLGEVASGDLDDTLSAAEKISRKLGAPAGGEFSGWLRDTVGALQLRDTRVLEALCDLPVPLATTNYDDLLERVSKLPAVTWRQPAKVFRFVRHEERSILHLHGFWDEPESVVLGIRSYEEVRQDAHAQAIRQALAMTQSLLFVGCGEGLSDPNFKPFLTWLEGVNATNEARHYRLALRRDLADVQRQHPAESRVVVVPYGDTHDALAGFLRRLLPSPITLREGGRVEGGASGESLSADHAAKTPPPAGDSPAILEYLRRLEAATSKLQLIGLGQGVQIELPIEQAYIPLNVVVSRELRSECPGHFPGDKFLPERGQPERDVELGDMFTWAGQFESRGVLVLGDPGAGKTTGARQFCWRLLKEADRTRTLGLPGRMIPVFLRLRHITGQHLSQKATGLQSFITDSVAATALPADLANPGPDLLARQGVLWVFDGLDEVVNENARVHVCGWIKQMLEQRPDDYFLVTSRYQGYQGRVDLGPAFCQFHVKPLSEPQVAEFVDHWYRAVFQRLQGRGADIQERAEREIASLIGMLRQPEYRIGRLRELPANPLMLTILCVVHHQDRNLPRRRADLYARCVRVLVEHWRQEVRDLQDVPGYDPEAAEAVLSAVAWGMHAQENRTTLSVAELGAIATTALADLAPGAGLGREGEAFIRRMRDESGILAMWNPGQCGFLHLTFQEYLAGLHAAREGKADDLVKQAGKSWWREVILLAAALGSKDFATKFFTSLVASDAVATEGAFVDQCLDEARYAVLEPFLAALRAPDVKPERQLDLLRRLKPFARPEAAELVAACRELACSPHPELAALATEILQRAGITIERPAIEVGAALLKQQVDSKTGMAFITIPAGEFDMGSDDWSDTKPIHRVRITKPFRLGKYPVTNAEYERFLKANSGAEPPRYWTNSQFNDPQQPVVGVSWEDAQVFCRWAGCRLPTEAEWEYACRAGNQGRYCFGDDAATLGEYAWYYENSGRKTQPVGQKKPNAWGLYDVHGNIWEWCEDWYGKYSGGPVSDPTGPTRGQRRVLRGGSWINSGGFCRSASRDGWRPSNRIHYLGFRVVLAPRSGAQDQGGAERGRPVRAGARDERRRSRPASRSGS